MAPFHAWKRGAVKPFLAPLGGYLPLTANSRLPGLVSGSCFGCEFGRHPLHPYAQRLTIWYYHPGNQPLAGMSAFPDAFVSNASYSQDV